MQFEINDIVYHISKDSPELIIRDYRVYSNGDIEYLVCAAIDKYNWIDEKELLDYKKF